MDNSIQCSLNMPLIKVVINFYPSSVRYWKIGKEALFELRGDTFFLWFYTENFLMVSVLNICNLEKNEQKTYLLTIEIKFLLIYANVLLFNIKK